MQEMSGRICQYSWEGEADDQSYIHTVKHSDSHPASYLLIYTVYVISKPARMP